MINTQINTLIDDLNKYPDNSISVILGITPLLDFDNDLWFTMAIETFNKHTQICRIEQRIKFEWGLINA